MSDSEDATSKKDIEDSILVQKVSALPETVGGGEWKCPCGSWETTAINTPAKQRTGLETALDSGHKQCSEGTFNLG